MKYIVNLIHANGSSNPSHHLDSWALEFIVKS